MWVQTMSKNISTKDIPACNCLYLPKLGCVEPERDKVNKGMAVAVQAFQDVLRDGYL